MYCAYGDEFYEFTKLGYKGLEEIWEVDPVYWSYFEVLCELTSLGYPTVNSLWGYNQMEFNNIVLSKDDMGTRRMKTIVVFIGTNYLYFIHPLSQLDIIEKPILSLEYNVLGTNVVEERNNDTKLGEKN